MKRDTIFFDLDGTLLPLDMDAFVAQYISILRQLDIKAAIGKNMTGYQLKRAFQYMLLPVHPDRSNEDAFFDYIESRYRIPREKIEPVFDRFYQEHFDLFKGNTRREPLVARLLIS